MAKKKEESSINGSEFMVLGLDKFQALAEYIINRPYKEVVGLIQVLQSAQTLDKFQAGK